MAQSYKSDDDYNPLGEHVVEIPGHGHPPHGAPRRSYATLGVAAFLALAGIGITVGIVSEQTHHARDEAAQRDELRVGWQMLGTLAADGADKDTNAAAQPAPTSAEPQNVIVQAPAAPAPAAPNVVVVNLPAQAANGTVAAPANGATQPAPAQGAPAQGAQVQFAPSTGVAAQPMSNGPAPAGSNGPPNAAVSGAGTVAASSPAQAALTGTVPAADAVQSRQPTSGALSPITYPASQMCGMTTCDTGSVCCNQSCGVCTPPGGTCSQQACN